MKKLDRINELVDELIELKLSNMASALDLLYHSGSFDHLDGVSSVQLQFRMEERSSIVIPVKRRWSSSCEILAASSWLLGHRRRPASILL